MPEVWQNHALAAGRQDRGVAPVRDWRYVNTMEWQRHDSVLGDGGY
jgi:hypothetical protein